MKQTELLISAYILLSLVAFGYLGYRYLNGEVYDAGYQAAILDIATRSLSNTGCDTGVVLGLGNEQYTYVKNVQCSVEDIQPTNIDLPPDPALFLEENPLEQ